MVEHGIEDAGVAGSNPAVPTKSPHRLMVRTTFFQDVDESSILSGVTHVALD